MPPWPNSKLTCPAGNATSRPRRLWSPKEGASEKWAKEKSRFYFVALLTIAEDSWTLDTGDEDAVGALMEREKIRKAGNGAIRYFKTDKGWLAQHLEKNGPGTIFKVPEPRRYTRVKE